MGIFQRMGNAIARFMYGRNGADKLGIVMIWGSLLLDLVSAMLLRHHRIAGSMVNWLATLMCCYALFRMFSKNLGKRREENQRFVNWLWRMKSKSSGARARHADKDHKYFTCKNCKTICRVPVGKGNVEITCPKCGAKIRGKT